MDLLVNDLSVHGQFHNLDDFRKAISRLMEIRKIANAARLELYCGGTLLNTKPINGMTMQQAVGNLDQNQTRTVLIWLSSRGGPFWDRVRQHGVDDYLDSNGNIVTDTAIGEAAYRKLHGKGAGLISLVPSDWAFSPISVTWNREAERMENKTTELDNWWDPETIQADLSNTSLPFTSWDEFHQSAISRFPNLTIADNCFDPLKKIKCNEYKASRFMELLSILNRLAQAFDANGSRTNEGNHLYSNYFVGRKAWFSNSTDQEIIKYRDELTFLNPDNPAESLLCSWHGKVRLQEIPLRIHYYWTMKAGDPVYVVYAGRKLTMN